MGTNLANNLKLLTIMKKFLLPFLLCFFTLFSYSQQDSFWKKETVVSDNSKVKTGKKIIKDAQIYSLNIESLRQALSKSPKRSDLSKKRNIIVSFPTSDGTFKNFRIIEASNFDPELQAKYPEIRSYAGQGVEDPSEVIRFSISPQGFQSMILSANQKASFIEPYTEDAGYYTVFDRTQKRDNDEDFICEVTAQMNKTLGKGLPSAMKNADDGVLRTYRLAVSATGEYTGYHGGTKASALAAINATMTRVNGIFEIDFGVTMVLIANTDAVIYTSISSDPYGNTTSGYNSALQSTLTDVIGEPNYDIGHLFAKIQNNGNAGCIGCVCVNGQKGSGWTSAEVPEGDFFDVDYVAHEMGHQFGANHTWTHNGNEGTNVQVEPGSGSTIMSYAGITGATDVQANVHPNFHAVSVEQVTDYVKTTSCQTNTNTGNAIPFVNAGTNYTIPRGTPFVLEGSATDADASDVLSYSWEQMDENNASTTYPSTTATTGVAFRAYEPTLSNKRYFPNISVVKTGATSWQWEAVPNVARNLNFRLTVRDNKAGGGANNSDDVLLTVSSSAGPFVLTSPNTNVIWNAGSLQTVTWNVAGTTANGVNVSNVDIFLSTDGGDTYPIALATGVPNNGVHNIVIPDKQGSQNRIMVRGSNHIFFDISNTNFTIEAPLICNADVPTGLSVSDVNETTATLNWDSVTGASYDLQYREAGTAIWTDIVATVATASLSGLTGLTDYEAQVRSRCPDNANSSFSTIVNFTTTDVQLNYCSSSSTNSSNEYISRVQLNDLNNSSGAQNYSDFTNLSTTLIKGSQYTIIITPNWNGRSRREAYGVWIDYNRDGDFTDPGEQVLSISATKANSVSGSFTVPNSAIENSTRMRVAMKNNDNSTPCEIFSNGEVEDYSIILQGLAADTTVPVISLVGNSTVNLTIGDSYSDQGATALDNLDGDLTANIITGGDVVDTNTVGTYTITYNVSDAAGNDAVQVIRTVIVNADVSAPVISLNGPSTINLNIGGVYTEFGASAIDNVDGDLTSSIVIEGDIVDTSAANTYLITYNVSDTAGNAATEVVRTVIVAPDTIAPVITLNGASTINLTIGDPPYSDQGATATDNVDGDISANIITGGDIVDTNTPATYFITYNVSDAAGNAATEVIRTVIVNPDSTAPVITLIGLSIIDITVGNTYTEQGATAFDNVDGDISANIAITVSVDTNTAGTYFVTYNVNDAAGNNATEIRTVNVNAIVTDVILNQGYFETGLDGWTEGGNDCSRTASSFSYEGSYSMRLRDGTSANSTMTLSNIDTSPYSQIIIDFYFYINGMNSGEGLLLGYYNGNSWTTIRSYIIGSQNINNFTFYNASVTLTAEQYTFVSNAGFRFQSAASKKNEQVYVDQITITGTNSGRGDVNQIVKIKTILPDENIDRNLKLYPNPVKGNVLNVELLESDKFTYAIKNMLGQVVVKGVSEGNVDVSELNAGMYFIEVNDGEDIMTKKFIRQ